MNNLLLPQKEKKLATAIGLLPALVILIFFYFLKLIAKILNKWKKQLYKASLAIFVIYGLSAFFGQIAHAPYANASQPITVEVPLPEKEANIALIKKIWGRDAELGLRIAKCESGYKTAGTHVANKDHSVDQGVFSINSVHGMPEMENAVANISYAYSMYLNQGTHPWDSSKECWK